MEKKVLVTVPLKDEQQKKLEDIAHKASMILKVKGVSELLPEDVEDVSIILGHIPPELIPHAKKLEWLQLSSAGADRYFRADALPEDVILTNAVGAYGLAVSEHMTAFTFSLLRRFPQYSRNQENHVWKIMGNVQAVSESTIVVLGMGNIGSMYAKQMKALGAYVIGVRRTNKEKPEWFDEQYTVDHLDDVLPRADVVAMVVPGNDETAKIMDARRMSLMKDGAYLLNVGRGSAVDTAALIDALKSGKLAGAALDVTDPEPLDPNNELWDMDNVLITPHASGNYLLKGTLDRVVNILTENFDNYTSGRPLRNIVDRKKGY
ncbi:MAG: D-2-hydroxyacid dehydrogenase [Oscillospiraceae bacterium]|nr:D-2-hydroxyacid dehydrogenase [Oscillospiraceae bacterium]